MIITSTSNDRIKNVVRLSSSHRHRRERQQTIVEGRREVRRCLDAGLNPVEVYICPELIDREDQDLVNHLHSQSQIGLGQLLEVSANVFARIAVRGESGGIVLVVPYMPLTLAALPLSEAPFLVVVEGVEKPGNVGAILRTADAAGVDGLILCSGGTDLHNPNVIRASLGTCFTVPMAEAPTDEVIPWLRQHQIITVAATPDASVRYTNVDLTLPTAIVTGSEAEGLSAQWLTVADHCVAIPMFGVTDSLNLATSTALMLYEVVRQRHGTAGRSGSF